jgi:hypothetical protein
MSSNEAQSSNAFNSTERASKKSLACLEELFALSCFCKLREACPDKSSNECLKHRNIYQEFMMRKVK